MSPARLAVSFIAGYIVTSQLNWLVAEKWLNAYVTPMFAGFMREGGDVNLAAIIIGMMLPVIAVTVVLALLERPRAWWARGLVAGGLVSLTTFFGAYSFLSGWGNVGLRPLMITACADSFTVIVGALVIAAIQGSRRSQLAATR
ncbi:MAG TPA: hypothetical protein VFR59_05400 [Steroidobacteraceae bacterium]|nr:hypothetical protein [Steroidobacteraceae bacterium]